MAGCCWATRGDIYRRLDLFLMRRFDHVITVSHATKNGLVTAAFAPHPSVSLHNAIETEVWSPPRRHATFGRNWDRATFPSGWLCGADHARKRSSHLGACGSPGSAKFPHAHFVLVGDGRMTDYCMIFSA